MMPGDGQTLEPGDYLVELRLFGLVDEDTLLQAVGQMGFQQIVLDESSEPSVVRFTATLGERIETRNTSAVQWVLSHRVSFPLFANLNLNYTLFPLTRARLYEMRFFGRMRDATSREATTKLLSDMGFVMDHVALLKRDMRLPGRPGASVAQWYGIGRWVRASSYVSDQDPFFFEDMAELAEEKGTNVIVHGTSVKPGPVETPPATVVQQHVAS